MGRQSKSSGPPPSFPLPRGIIVSRTIWAARQGRRATRARILFFHLARTPPLVRSMGSVRRDHLGESWASMSDATCKESWGWEERGFGPSPSGDGVPVAARSCVCRCKLGEVSTDVRVCLVEATPPPRDMTPRAASGMVDGT